MTLQSAEHLADALRDSGLFAPDQLAAIAADLSGADLDAGMRRLLKRGRLTPYQLGKIIRGKAADLRIGPYLVLDKVGEGGMGKVFRARHLARERTVALKVIRPALLANPTVRGRYAREVESAGKLDHPNIVRVEDAGEDAGKFFLAMEFIDGVDLSRLMHDARSLEVVEACEYVRQAALGLQHAHDHGLVHRDVKPSNVVVAGVRHLPQADGPAAVKLLDLGLARAIDPDDMVAPDLTRDHAVVGTPDYMAPEQARNSKRVDGRADLYALGGTLYFLLTGRPPFPGGTAVEKVMRHQVEHPAPLQGLRPGVPGAVAALVAKLMAKKPDERFPSAAALAEALAPFARYPRGAARTAVPVPVLALEPAGAAAASSTTSVPALGSTGGSESSLRLPPEPRAAVATPSDRTPRPSPKRRKVPPRRAPKRSRRAVWVTAGAAVAALFGAAVLVALALLLR